MYRFYLAAGSAVSHDLPQAYTIPASELAQTSLSVLIYQMKIN